MRRAGFTGTRHGMSPRQAMSFERELGAWAKADDATLHHGDCLGADAEAHEAARRLGMAVTLHPPKNGYMQAYCEGDEARVPMGFIERNHAIVDECEVLFAAPFEYTEIERSGTWATIRYAGKCLRPTMVVFPNGAVLYKPVGWQ